MILRRAIIAAGVAGFSVFASVLAASFAAPIWIGRLGREVIRLEVERRVGERIDQLTDGRLVDLAGKMARKNDAELAGLRAQMRAEVPRKVADVVANMLNADCECRKRLRHSFELGVRTEELRLTALQGRLTSFAEHAYSQTTQALLRELRIFCIVNSIAFLSLALLGYFRPQADRHLLLPATAMLGAIGVTAFCYLVKQDWLHTILFGDYWGWGYALYFCGIALCLLDVALNRARVLTRIINWMLNAVGSLAAITPC